MAATKCWPVIGAVIGLVARSLIDFMSMIIGHRKDKGGIVCVLIVGIPAAPVIAADNPAIVELCNGHAWPTVVAIAMKNTGIQAISYAAVAHGPIGAKTIGAPVADLVNALTCE